MSVESEIHKHSFLRRFGKEEDRLHHYNEAVKKIWHTTPEELLQVNAADPEIQQVVSNEFSKVWESDDERH